MEPTISKIRWTLPIAPAVCALYALACSAPAAPPAAGGGAGGSGNTTASGGSGAVVNPTGGAGGVTNPTGGAGGVTNPTGGAAGVSGSGGGGAGTPPVDGTFSNYQLNGAWPSLTSVVPTTAATLSYTKKMIHTRFLAESCSIADYNGDGNPDVSSGKRWWEGPDFTVEHPFRDGHGDLPRDGNGPEIDTGVSDDWSDFPWDVNGDGFADIINIANCDVPATAIQFAWDPMSQNPGTVYWYQNPGANWATNPPWERHQLAADLVHEHKSMGDVNNDGKPEILGACKGCQPNSTKGYYSADWTNPSAAWTWNPITPTIEFAFGNTGWMHGLGFGDVNGDGMTDMLDRDGIWEQGAGTWTLNPIDLYDGQPGDGQKGAAHMYAWDIDGDGDNDIFAADWAHGERLAWYEQTTPGAFEKHYFMGNQDEAGQYGGLYFSQPHAAQAVDMDGDGVRDIVTGKMRFAHPNGYGDPDITGTPVIYVFKTVRDGSNTSGGATFEPHLVDAEVGDPAIPTGTPGVGRQLSVGHINTDGKVDICVGTKLGLYVYLGQ